MTRLEKLITGGIDADGLAEARSLLAAWLAAKLERFPAMRDESYTPPTDEQRALLACELIGLGAKPLETLGRPSRQLFG